MTVTFWLIVGFVLYAYFGYPLLLSIFTKLFNRSEKVDSENHYDWPQVSLLIAAYNEEKVINRKIDNCLALKYPQNRLNIWIASDGSTDGTNEIVRKYSQMYENIHLLEYPRSGKSGILNKALEELDSEIVVFSDANTEYASDAIKRLVSHFKNSNVGCVSGRLIYRNPGGIISGKGESLYWKYETMLKKMESKLGYVAGANGAVYAIRRELFEPFPPRTVNDDFTLSMRIVRKGYGSVYDDSVKVYEDVAPTMESEFRRHIRDGAGHYIAIIHLAGLLNPFLGLRSFIYMSHRIFRWLVPFFLILLLAFNIILSNGLLYKFLLVFQCIFYFFAIIGWLCSKSLKIPFFLYVPFYFCNLNLALFLGFFKAISNKQKTTWERTER